MTTGVPTTAEASGVAPNDAAVDRALAWLYAQSRGGAPRDPERMRRLIDRLGAVQPARVVHIVGTNGKGGVAARIDAALRAAGERPLRFLSPHVERFSERIAVDGVEIDDGAIVAFVNAVRSAHPPVDASFFELVLTLALREAAERDATWAVVEAGVGAARDATSVLTGVVATVITNVGADHLRELGPTLADVARDKAAALRPGVPAVTGAEGEALAVIRRIAADRGTPLQVVPATGTTERRATALAVAAVRTLPLRDAARAAAAAAAAPPRLPARRERFDGPEDRCVLLDGAHNPPALAALVAEAPTDARALLGVAARKAPSACLAALGPLSTDAVLTAAVPGERPFGDHPRFESDPDRALDRALAATPPGGTLLVTGSFWLAGRLRPRLRAWAGERSAPTDGGSPARAD